MDRHLLIAVSEQNSALHGVRFAGQFFSGKSEIKSTFFYSCTPPDAQYPDDTDLDPIQWTKEQEKKVTEAGKEVLDSAVGEAVQLGFPEGNLYRKLQSRVFTTVTDIINEGEKGSYDAVVLGRRGMNMLEKAFEESVSRALFDEKLGFPLWLCRSSEPNRKHVLFHADGSRASFNMADHIGFMLSAENRHRVDILPTGNVSGDSSIKKGYEEIFAAYKLSVDRVSFLSPPKGDPATFILETAERKSYAAVALGRSNRNGSVLSRLFKGPVCSKLFKDLQNAALWVCN